MYHLILELHYFEFPFLFFKFEAAFFHTSLIIPGIFDFSFPVPYDLDLKGKEVEYLYG